MKKDLNLKERKPLWVALSEFYLDTELQAHDYQHIAKLIDESPYSFEEAKQINKEEVFPVLSSNLISVAGVWSGFEEEWLCSQIVLKINSLNRFSRWCYKLFYSRLKWVFNAHFQELEKQRNLRP